MLWGAAASAASQLLFCAVCAWMPAHPWAFALACLLVILTAAFSSLYLITSLTVLQLKVPETLRGRVMSLHGITFSLISLGALFGGGLASWVGAPIAVAIGAAIVLVSVSLVWFRYFHWLRT